MVINSGLLAGTRLCADSAFKPQVLDVIGVKNGVEPFA